MNKIFICISYLTILTVLGLMVLFLYWMIAPYKPIIFNNLPFKVMNKTVRQGKLLIYTADFCKYNHLVPVAKKSFVDGVIFSLPTEIVLAKDMGCKVMHFSLIIPETLPEGEYVLKITYRYQVNPIRTVDVLTETERFTVLSK